MSASDSLPYPLSCSSSLRLNHSRPILLRKATHTSIVLLLMGCLLPAVCPCRFRPVSRSQKPSCLRFLLYFLPKKKPQVRLPSGNKKALCSLCACAMQYAIQFLALSR